MLDIHTTFALQNGIKAYLSDLAAFRFLFPESLDADAVAAWHAKLVEAPPLVRGLLGRGVVESKSPWVVVSLDTETPEQTFMGEVGGRDDEGIEIYERIQTQAVRVSVITSNPEIGRALHTMIAAIMLLASHDFIRAGYESLEYLGTDDLHPMEDTISLELGLFVRAQRYQARSVLVAKKPSALAAPAFDWFVQLEGVAADVSWPVDPDHPSPGPGAGEPGSVSGE